MLNNQQTTTSLRYAVRNHGSLKQSRNKQTDLASPTTERRASLMDICFVGELVLTCIHKFMSSPIAFPLFFMRLLLLLWWWWWWWWWWCLRTQAHTYMHVLPRRYTNIFAYTLVRAHTLTQTHAHTEGTEGEAETDRRWTN